MLCVRWPVGIRAYCDRFGLPAALFLGSNPRHQDRTACAQFAAEAEDWETRCLGEMVNLASLSGVIKQEIGYLVRAAQEVMG
jgi:hypothetical protein